MIYQFSFQTQAHLDEVDYSDAHDHKECNLPTTTHNSPGSTKSDAPELDISHDNSFEAGMQVNHAHDVWAASLDFLRHSLYTVVDEERGLNSFVPSALSSKTLDEALRENKLLRSRDRTRFIQALQNESEVCGLLVELMLMFNGAIFNELTYVIQNLWERKYLPFRERKSSAAKLLPQFNCFFGFEGEEQDIDSVAMFGEPNLGEIRAAAAEGMEELGHELFYSKKLRYFNLQSVAESKAEKQVLKGHFIVLLKVLSKAVFLSAEGVYEDEVRIPIFSEQEEEECEPFELEGNKFVRTFSQIQQDDECDTFLSSKRRKLQ